MEITSYNDKCIRDRPRKRSWKAKGVTYNLHGVREVAPRKFRAHMPADSLAYGAPLATNLKPHHSNSNLLTTTITHMNRIHSCVSYVARY